MRFTKVEATGNDFLVRLEPATAPLPPALVAALCDRHRGVGADGVITIGPGVDGADCTMLLQNADGGPAEISGNGARAVALVAAAAGLGTETTLVVDTGSGRRVIRLDRDPSGSVIAAEVDMGPVTIGPSDLEVAVAGSTHRGDVVSVGNPHYVCFVPDPAAVDLDRIGPGIEHAPQFPERTNVHFVRVEDPATITMHIWERGVGPTLSCGSGACAAAAAAHARGLVGDTVTVRVPGGELTVTLGETARLAGPAVAVCEVEVDADGLLRS
ncbi:MAG: diaminopimelate epimerase [Actinomycetota bacterium]